MNTPPDTLRDSREFVYELKFLVGAGQVGALQEWARARLDPDPHGGGAHGDSYQVSSVYFDTSRYDVLARQGSYARAKYRVRRYNQSDTVYLERKVRGRLRVFKRRSAAALDELLRLKARQLSPGWHGHWFHRRLLLRALGAVTRVDYQRIARVGRSDYGPVRLTLDQELHAWRTDALSFEEPAARGAPLSCQQLILELKFGQAMPAIFKELIREFAPQPQGISKYRLACLALGLGDAAVNGEAAAPLNGVRAAPGTSQLVGDELDA